MLPALVEAPSCAAWPSPHRLTPRRAEPVGSFAQRCLLVAYSRKMEVRGTAGGVELVARPGDTLETVLAPFYRSARW